MSLVDSFVEKIRKVNPLHHSYLNESLEKLSENDASEFEKYILYCSDIGVSVDDLVGHYNSFLENFREEQLYFHRHGSYRFDSYSEVAHKVYLNDDYMTTYMYGGAVSLFLWPNHKALKAFFLETLPKRREGSYLEVGTGHGYYFMSAVRLTSFKSFLGVDVSKTSLGMTRSIVDYFCPERKDHVLFNETNFFDMKESDTFDAIVSGEVLEHVEDPDAFLRKIWNLSHEGTYVHLTTCCNAGSLDHIQLFKEPKEVESIIFEAGFNVTDKIYLPYVGKTIEECEKEGLCINMGYTLEKRVV